MGVWGSILDLLSSEGVLRGVIVSALPTSLIAWKLNENSKRRERRTEFTFREKHRTYSEFIQRLSEALVILSSVVQLRTAVDSRKRKDERILALLAVAHSCRYPVPSIRAVYDKTHAELDTEVMAVYDHISGRLAETMHKLVASRFEVGLLTGDSEVIEIVDRCVQRLSQIFDALLEKDIERAVTELTTLRLVMDDARRKLSYDLRRDL